MKKKIITQIGLGLFLLFALLMPAGRAQAANAATGNWTQYQNSSCNNGVTERPGPTDASHAVALWDVSMGSTATTPPLIVDDKIYTASGYYVYCYDKTTGKKLGQSDKLNGYVGHALHPMVYAEGKLFVITGKGGTMVEALSLNDAANPKRVWSSTPQPGTSYSPLSYHYNESENQGYLYTGTFNGDEKGIYFCVSATDGKLVWSREDENGFYWAGAYATDQYVAFASENEAGGNDESDGSALYTVDSDGNVIDSITNLKGSIRNTVVFDNGYLYVGTVAGRIYRIKVDSNGNLGKYSGENDENFSYIDFDGRIKATMLIYNNRIYAGVEGKETGTSCYKVIDCSEAFHKSSVIGSVPVEDEPKGAPILSTAEDGTVYIYFTCNQTNGGIYYFKDSVDGLSPTSQCLFEPEASQQQKCISSLALDSEGTLYYTNDSHYLMAVAPKIIKDVEITSSVSSGVRWDDQRFEPGVRSYHLTAGDSVKKLQFNVKQLDSENEEVSCKFVVNGTEQGNDTTVSLDGETTNVELQVTRKAITVGYHFIIYKVTSQNTSLSLLYYGQNFYSGNNLLPQIEEGRTEYSADLRNTSVNDAYLWILPLHSRAEIEAYAVENVKNPRTDTELKSGKVLDWIYIEPLSGEYKYKVKPADSKKNTVIRIRVTSADGSKTQDYQVKFIRTSETQSVTPSDPSPKPTIPQKKPISIAKASARLSGTSYVYSGKEKKPGVKVTYQGKTLVNGTDYTVAYKNNKKVGTASVVIRGKGNYSGTKTLTFKINPKATAIKALKKGKKQISVTWKKASSQVSGYQIMYSTNKKFKNSKKITVPGISKTTKTMKKLSAKKQYYVKVRTYKTAGGKEYYSSWSNVKSVKTK